MSSPKPARYTRGMEDYTALDRLIMKHIMTKTPKEIADMAGVAPHEVLHRKDELLNSIDALTLDQRRALLIFKLSEIAEDAMETSKHIESEFYAGTLNSSIAAFKEVLRQIEVTEKRDTDRVERLNMLRVRELVNLMDRTVVAGAVELAGRFGVEESEILEVFQGRLQIEAKRMEDEAL